MGYITKLGPLYHKRRCPDKRFVTNHASGHAPPIPAGKAVRRSSECDGSTRLSLSSLALFCQINRFTPRTDWNRD